VRQEIPRDVRRIDQEVAILDPDVDVRAEDQQLPREILHRVLRADVALERGDLLIDPVRERVRSRRPRSRVLEPASSITPRLRRTELFAHFLRRATNVVSRPRRSTDAARASPARGSVVVLEQLRDVRLQLASLRVDDLVLFFDADR
jgi:hypothetical protein